MEFEPTRLPEVVLIKPRVFGDARGFFFETWQQQKFAAAGIDARFVQDNHSHSARHTLRGLHFQIQQPQGKLVRVTPRRGVRCRGRHPAQLAALWAVGRRQLLSDTNHHMLWVPPGFAHGYLALSDEIDFLYKCTDFYAPQHERAIRWNDPADRRAVAVAGGRRADSVRQGRGGAAVQGCRDRTREGADHRRLRPGGQRAAAAACHRRHRAARADPIASSISAMRARCAPRSRAVEPGAHHQRGGLHGGRQGRIRTRSWRMRSMPRRRVIWPQAAHSTRRLPPDPYLHRLRVRRPRRRALSARRCDASAQRLRAQQARRASRRCSRCLASAPWSCAPPGCTRRRARISC